MNSKKRKRGRPKSSQTLELEKTEALFKNLPAHTKMSSEEREELEKRLAESKKIEDQIYAGHSPTIPHDLILAMESLGDRELFEEDEELLNAEAVVIEKYNKLEEATKRGQKDGAAVIAKKAFIRAKTFWDSNPDFFEAMGRPRNANTTAQRIIDNWPTCGNGGKLPSINTIKNWYKLIQNSKGSSYKK